MSITPRPPPRSTRRVDRGSRDTAPWYGRALARLSAGLRRAGRWVREFVSDTDERRPEGESSSEERTQQRSRRRPLQSTGGASTDKHEADVAASLPAGAVLEEPELPARPNLELERTEGSLTIRRPGRDGAYIASDEWSDVKR